MHSSQVVGESLKLGMFLTFWVGSISLLTPKLHVDIVEQWVTISSSLYHRNEAVRTQTMWLSLAHCFNVSFSLVSSNFFYISESDIWVRSDQHWASCPNQQKKRVRIRLCQTILCFHRPLVISSVSFLLSRDAPIILRDFLDTIIMTLNLKISPLYVLNFDHGV